MDTINKIIQFVLSSQKEILDALAYIIAGASVIVKLTPTLKDDNYLKPIVRFIGKFLALDKFGPNSGKETPK